MLILLIDSVLLIILKSYSTDFSRIWSLLPLLFYFAFLHMHFSFIFEKNCGVHIMVPFLHGQTVSWELCTASRLFPVLYLPVKKRYYIYRFFTTGRNVIASYCLHYQLTASIYIVYWQIHIVYRLLPSSNRVAWQNVAIKNKLLVAAIMVKKLWVLKLSFGVIV